jgi:hypothetical protein
MGISKRKLKMKLNVVFWDVALCRTRVNRSEERIASILKCCNLTLIDQEKIYTKSKSII